MPVNISSPEHLYSGQYSSGQYSSPWTREFPLDEENLPPHVQDLAIVGGLSPIAIVAGQTLHLVLPECTIGTPIAPPWSANLCYGSRLSPRLRPGSAGPGWLVTEFPFLISRFNVQQNREIGVIGRGLRGWWFSENSKGEWVSAGETKARLKHDTVSRSFLFEESNGLVWKFHNFENEIPRQIRGSLKQAAIMSERIVLRFTEFDEIRKFEFPATQNGRFEVRHEYKECSDLTQRITTRTFLSNGNEISRTSFAYNQIDLLESVRFDIKTEEEWKETRAATFAYGDQAAYPGGYPLLKQALISWAHRSEGALTFTQSRCEYHMGYGAAGKLNWIHTVGDGPEPVYAT